MSSKMKTRRAAAKRFSVNANGKVKFKRAHKRHCLECKSKKMKRQARPGGHLPEQDAKHVRLMLPYGSK
jgi:large subunit ribosomal protein L35